MTTSNNFLQKTELDFNSLRDSIKGTLSGQVRIRDYNYEGSNMAIIVDLLTWNSHLNAHYLNMVGTEMWLDTAQMQDSVFSHSKELNYIPRSSSCPRAKVIFSMDVGAATPDVITLPRYFTVTTGAVDENGLRRSYEFLTTSVNLVKRNQAGFYVSDSVEVLQGELGIEAFTVAEDKRYVLQKLDIDTSTIRVLVGSSTNDPLAEEYVKSPNLYGVKATDKVYFLQAAYDGRYEIVFGNGSIGFAPPIGAVVRVEYIVTDGELANGASRFSTGSLADGFEVSSVVTVERAYGGAGPEDIESIRFNAPRHFTTQERAVTKQDYVNLLREKFPQLESITAYGGEEVVPKRYGKIIISAKPYGDTIMTDRLKSDVVAFLNTKNIVTEAVVEDPDYLYIAVETEIVYDPSITKSSAENIRTTAALAVKNFISTELGDFGVDFRYSRLVTAIDSSDPSIVSNDTKLKLVKRWKPKTGRKDSIIFGYGNPLLVETRFYNPLTQDPIVRTNEFEYLKNGVVYNIVVQDDGDGKLFAYTSRDGGKVLIENDVGSVDYATGSISISMNVYSYGDSIDIIANPEKKDVKIKTNQFLTSSDTYITVTITETER